MPKKLKLDHCVQPKPFADRDAYEKELERLQLKMLSAQQAYFHEKRRAVIVFEGWDAAGKGGAIRRLTERLDPRGFHVWPIGAPNQLEQGRHYLYRFWRRLPERGTIAIFDRSWYGRVLVERVEGLAKKEEWKRGYREIKEFERMLVDDGVRLVKIFLHITPHEQLQRFAERLSNPYKRWKLTDDDIRNHRRWDDYVEAVEDMFKHTSTKFAPWTAIYAVRKWAARIEVLKTVTDALAHGVDLTPPPIDPTIRKFAMRSLGREMKKALAKQGAGKKKTKR